MKTYALFIRGINVGGITLKMDDLKKILDELGLKNVKTYIQSGNAVFDAGEINKTFLEKKINEATKRTSELDVAVFVKTKEQMHHILSSNPLGKNMDEKRIYATMLDKAPPKEKLGKIEALNSPEEKFILNGDVIYGYYGNGYGKSKYTNNYFEKVLGVTATTRNWNTMKTMSDLMNGGIP